MSTAYNLETLRPLSLFAPDVRLQQVTVEVEPRQIGLLGRGREAEVIFVLRRPPDEVLLVNKAAYPAGTYRLPTGGVEAAESPQAAAVREIYEETGYRVTGPGLVGVVDYTLYWQEPPAPQPTDTAFVSYVFTAEVADDQEPEAALPGEIQGYRWVPLHELDEIARHLRSLPQDWVYWGRFRAVSYEFIRCGIMQYDRTAGSQIVAGRW
jgi:8-oxo-dGTP pyrophosphatase MutT (NUDIX family)